MKVTSGEIFGPDLLFYKAFISYTVRKLWMRAPGNLLVKEQDYQSIGIIVNFFSRNTFILQYNSVI